MKIKLFIFLSLFALGYSSSQCPSPQVISQEITFDKVVIEKPFPFPYNGMNVFNGVKNQNKGICKNLPIRYCTLPTTKCICEAFSQYLLFNLIPTNENQTLTPENITTAVRQAKNITYIESFNPNPLIPNILCLYDISQWSHSFSCLPKFCNKPINNTIIPCIHSTNNCTCIAQPCNLYVSIPI